MNKYQHLDTLEAMSVLLDDIEEGVPEERIVKKMMKRFGLVGEKAGEHVKM